MDCLSHFGELHSARISFLLFVVRCCVTLLVGGLGLTVNSIHIHVVWLSGRLLTMTLHDGENLCSVE